MLHRSKGAGISRNREEESELKLVNTIKKNKIAVAILSVVLVVPLIVQLVRYLSRPKIMKTNVRQEHGGTAKRLIICLVVAAIGIATLGVISFFLGQRVVDPDGNILGTGELRVNLNDGKPLVTEEDVIGPGCDIEKTFFIENLGNYDAWYKLYFENVDGKIADIVEVTIQSGEKVLLQGKVSELTADRVSAMEELLPKGARKTLTATFHIPETYGNEIQKQSVTFRLGAKAVQANNNEAKDFGD